MYGSLRSKRAIVKKTVNETKKTEIEMITFRFFKSAKNRHLRLKYFLQTTSLSLIFFNATISNQPFSGCDRQVETPDWESAPDREFPEPSFRWEPTPSPPVRCGFLR